MIKNLLEKGALYSINNPASFLRNTAVGIFALSALGQAWGISKNKELPKKEKSFLIPQELINGSLQIATFVLVAKKLENLAGALFDKGIITSQFAGKNVAALRGGLVTAFSMAGTLIAFNLITPIIRNPIAILFQKLTKKDLGNNEQLVRPVIASSTMNSDIRNSANFPFKTFYSSLETNKLPNRNLTSIPTTAYRSSGLRV